MKGDTVPRRLADYHPDIKIMFMHDTNGHAWWAHRATGTIYLSTQLDPPAAGAALLEACEALTAETSSGHIKVITG
jgi:uncharacterized protein (DUF736 family)